MARRIDAAQRLHPLLILCAQPGEGFVPVPLGLLADLLDTLGRVRAHLLLYRALIFIQARQRFEAGLLRLLHKLASPIVIFQEQLDDPLHCISPFAVKKFEFLPILILSSVIRFFLICKHFQNRFHAFLNSYA